MCAMNLFILFMCFSIIGCGKIIKILPSKAPICLTEECQNTGYNIFSSLNSSKNPCTNFYEFSCGNWESNNQVPFSDSEPFWNQWLRNEFLIRKRLETILSKYQLKNKNLIKINKLYKSCLNRDDNELSYLKEARILIDKLGGWKGLITSNGASPDGEKQNNSWVLKVAEVTRLFGVHPLIKMHVVIDLQDTSKYILRIDPGDLSLPLWILENPLRYLEHINAYHNWIYKTMSLILPNVDENTLQVQALYLIQLEIEIARLHKIKQKFVKLPFKKMHKRVPGNDWNKILKILFENTKIAVNPTTIAVQIGKLEYLQKLDEALKYTERQIIHNYILWTVVKDLSRDITKETRHLNFLINSNIFKTKIDFSTTRECIDLVSYHFDPVLLPIYVTEYSLQEDIEDVKNISELIRKQFIKNLEENSWLYFSTKLEAVEKIKNMKFLFGEFSERLNGTTLEKYYDELNITENYFLNVIKLKSFRTQKMLEKLNNEVEETVVPERAIQSNAYYNMIQNSVIIPLALLEPPFYYRNASIRAINFGAIGSLIGHEMSHSLDWNGRRFDSNNQMTKWWSQKDYLNYEFREECFRKFYNVTDNDWKISVDENIADFVGIITSYQAYQELNDDPNQNENVITPFLESYTKEQLFFIGYSQVWCETIENQNFVYRDEHLPVNVRVESVLQNLNWFQKNFNCENNEKPMCTLW